MIIKIKTKKRFLTQSKKKKVVHVLWSKNKENKIVPSRYATN